MSTLPATIQDERTILLIEDDEATRHRHRKYLGFAGFRVLEATSGRMGVQLAKSETPDLILCELMMPDISGYDVLRAVRSDESSMFVPFVLTSSDTSPVSQRIAMEMGADDYLHKPVERTELLVAVNTHLVKRYEFVSAQRIHRAEMKKAQTMLSITVAHELRTPLISIIMAKDLMAMQLEDLSHAEMRDLLNSIDKGSRRLRHMVEQMALLTQLETSVLTADYVQLNGTAMPLSSLVEAALALAREFDYQQLQTTFEVAPSEGQDLIWCDAPSMKHVLAEVLHNAMMFSAESHKPVAVSQWQEEGAVKLSILDYGRGMNPMDIPRAFEAFQQLDRHITEQQGIGLGLTLTKRVTDLHQGVVEVFSVRRKGTQVLITLPLANSGGRG